MRPSRREERVAMPPPEADPPATQAEQAFGELLAHHRRQIGLSQQELAARICIESGRPTVTRHEVSRYERGRRLPTWALLTAIASSLNVPADEVRHAAAKERQRRRGAR
ncbi:helix-turn-helix domain-containing protein [Dactylosporangium sp. CA-052675]|uniref:helix-turn-helix domain-containing protein n=1 Tax=Dactylosporangium sp. CA-052675 TaxID=3239927 RepID=UPI003D8D950F